MGELRAENRIEELRLELQLRQEEYKRSLEYRKERRKDRLHIFGCVLSFALIVGIFVGIAIDGEVVKVRIGLEDRIYETSVLHQDCYLCGDNPESPMARYWGQNNLGLINLNTMECLTLDVNQYDECGNWIQTLERYGHHRGHFGNNEIGSTADYSLYRNRGYLSLTVNFNDNSVLHTDNLKAYFCTDCCSAIINEYFYDEAHWDIALVNFARRELYVLEDNGFSAWSRGDYYITLEYNDTADNFSIDGFFTPMRFTELAYDESETVLEQIELWCTEKNFAFDVNDELVEFISGFERIQGISYTDKYVEFSEWGSEYRSLYITADGSYQIYQH